MKKNFFAVILLLAVSFVSCKKETGNSNQVNQPSAESILTGSQRSDQNSGKMIPPQSALWIVGSMIINGSDETRSYSSFSFEFTTDNIVTATDGNITVYGKWYMMDAQRLFVFFDVSGLPDYLTIAFENLNGEWVVLRKSLLSMYLESYDFRRLRELRLDRRL